MTKVKRIIAVAMLASIATVAFADEAPVYDVDNNDNYPPSFEQPDQAYSPPPPPAERLAEDASSGAPNELTPQQRLKQVEQQIKNLQTSSSSTKVEALQGEVRSLRGEIEELTHELEQLKSIQKSMYSDLENQLNQMLAKVNTNKVQAEAHPASSEEDSDTVTESPRDTIPTKPIKLLSTAVPPDVEDHAPPLSVKKAASKISAAGQPDAAEEQQIYQTAYDLIKAKKYNEAISTLKSMLKKYPSGQFAANAHYWLGELYGLLNKNDQSAEEFAIVVKDYPDSPKSADAELKLGLIYVGEFKWVDAKTAFKKVISRSPGTASARLAMEQLKQIKKAGH